MFKSAKCYLSKVKRSQLLLTYCFSLVLIITIIYRTISQDINANYSKIHSPIPEFCKVTSKIQAIRQQQNTSHINPARQVVEELLQFVTYNPNTCRPDKQAGERLVVAIVNTARGHFEPRQAIRRTWGSVVQYKNWHVQTVFLVGQSDYCLSIDKENSIKDQGRQDKVSMEEKSLQQEFRKYGDLVIGAFTDTYRNLTYKHLMGYKFIQEICPHADFIIKTDDDFFVDMFGIIDKRESELNARNARNSSVEQEHYDIYCHYYNDSPTRDANGTNGKWFSTREEWPEDTYPSYCLGGDYAISMSWLKKIYSVRGDGGFFWVDDVFIMGELREMAEKTYNESSNRMSLGDAVKMTDSRQMPANYVRDNCKKDDVDFGWFVFLVRSDKEFRANMNCLWRKSLRSANITTVLRTF